MTVVPEWSRWLTVSVRIGKGEIALGSYDYERSYGVRVSWSWRDRWHCKAWQFISFVRKEPIHG